MAGKHTNLFILMIGKFLIGSKKNIGVLIIATGIYIKFAKNLIDSIMSNSINKNNIIFFLFTDSDKSALNFNSSYNINTIFWSHKPWPLTTLQRYQAFVENEKLFQKISHLVYIDVDMKVNCDLNDFQNHKIFAVVHPGYRNKKRTKFPLENRISCSAYFDKMLASNYYCGGIQGGEIREYLELCKIMNKRINSDLDNNMIAVWHDESHWNKVVNENIRKFSILGSEFCWPEEWSTVKFPGKIVALQKKPNAFRPTRTLDNIVYKLMKIQNLLLRHLYLRRY